MTIGRLSGGERARISIAHLMLQPADVLLLDEPTNDLDIPTLETLEESLMEFPGAVVLITHDRCMLDRICNQLLALGDPDKTQLYADYSQWEKDQRGARREGEKREIGNGQGNGNGNEKRKLSYMEKKEYDEIEGKIAKLEEEVQTLNRTLEKPEIAKDAQKLSEVCLAISLAETQIEQLYLRWQELDQKRT